MSRIAAAFSFDVELLHIGAANEILGPTKEAIDVLDGLLVFLEVVFTLLMMVMIVVVVAPLLLAHVFLVEEVPAPVSGVVSRTNPKGHLLGEVEIHLREDRIEDRRYDQIDELGEDLRAALASLWKSVFTH